jgi:hypothetical protein
MIWWMLLVIVLVAVPLLAATGSERRNRWLPRAALGFSLVLGAISMVVRLALVIMFAFLSLGRLILWDDRRR